MDIVASGNKSVGHHAGDRCADLGVRQIQLGFFQCCCGSSELCFGLFKPAEAAIEQFCGNGILLFQAECTLILAFGQRQCAFGFRRGADGSVTKADISAAYEFYREVTTKPDDPAALAFRASHATEIEIHFIGVWDTVGSLGIPDTASWFPYARARYQFHDTELSKIVKYAYQALALDEHRADFAPTVWTRNPYTIKPGETLTSKKLEQIEIEQRWFIGSHSDVGGGNDRDGAGRKPDPLPELPLAWLQRKAINAGLAFDELIAPAIDADMGMPRNSYAEFMYGIYKEFKPPFDRTLGTGINEKVDDSVWQRWLADGSYRSPSMVQALARATVLMSADAVVQITPANADQPTPSA